MHKENKFIVYKSSAGSGKTFTLTREYLKLAFLSPDHFKKILAVTFTNKATQEMKERILHYLFQFSLGKLDGMSAQLMQSCELTELQLQEKSKLLLESILHHFSRFSVQTIDRFFQNVMRSFARELSLQGDGELILNSDEVRDAVVDLLMENLSTNQALRDWMLAFSIDKLENKGKWDVRRDIIAFASELLKDDFKVKEHALNEAIQDDDKLRSYKRKIDQIINTFETDLNQIGVDANALIASHGLALDDFSHKNGSAPNFFNNIQKDKCKYDIGSRVYETLEKSGDNLANKTSPKKTEIMHLAQSGLLDYFQKAVDYIGTNQMQYLSAKQIKRNIYLLGISWQFNALMQQYKQEEGIQFLSDTTQFLNEIIGTDPSESPFIYEKMGSFYDHFLMDEFQDTSTLQWRNFKPLIENSLAEGHQNLVVGDIKQSIYRWRGGDWRLLLKGLKEDISTNFYQEETLEHNFRSKPNIIDFNNQLFEQLPELVQNYALNRNTAAFPTEFADLLKDLKLAYAEVHQQKKDDYPDDGYVKLQFFETEKDESDEKAKWKSLALAQFVADLEAVQEKGVKLNDVGILIRTKAEGYAVQDYIENYLLEHPDKANLYHYQIISDETLLVSSAHIVNFLLNCFKYLYTDDQIALAQMKFYYQKIVLRNSKDIHSIVHFDNEITFLPKDFIIQQKEFLSYNLLEMSERLIQIFELKAISNEKAYLSAFQDILLEFGNQGGIPDFLEWWEQNSNSYAVKLQASENAARMMTIHKAKGLEFKVCMIPLLDWQICSIGNQAPTLWLDTQQTSFSEIPFLPIKHGSALKDTIFAADYWQEEVKSFLDNLNVLYVALTRAGDALFVNSCGNAKASYISVFLKEFAMQQNKYWDETNQRLVMGKIDDLQLITIENTKENKILKSVDLAYYDSHEWKGKLQIKQSNYLIADDSGLSKTDLGIHVHDIFARLNQLTELPVLLQKIQAEAMLNEADFHTVKTLVVDNLKEGSVLRDWFETDWQVKAEVPVLLPNGDLIRIDRVLIKKQQAKILDFKTGLKDEKHRKQVSFYRSSLKRMGFDHVSAHIAYLNPFELVEVV